MSDGDVQERGIARQGIRLEEEFEVHHIVDDDLVGLMRTRGI